MLATESMDLPTPASESPPTAYVGRYAIYDEIASGGMAAVHLGRLIGSEGFTRTVAIKRMHAHLAKDAEFTKMFLDEARLAARVCHPNVVSTIDVVTSKGELFVVMDFVHGQSLSWLWDAMQARAERMPIGVVLHVMSGVLQGLHAAHEAVGDQGESLGLVHRDVSPHNILVGTDGISRLIDFGVAKARGRQQTTREGQIKGKLEYMAPEQILGDAVDRRSDIFGAAVVIWQLLTGRKLFEAENEGQLVYKLLESPILPPSAFASQVASDLDAVVLRGLSREPDERFATAHEMALALERVGPVATQRQVGDWVSQAAKDWLGKLEAFNERIDDTVAGVDADLALSMPTLAAAKKDSISTVREKPTVLSSASTLFAAPSETGVSLLHSQRFAPVLLTQVALAPPDFGSPAIQQFIAEMQGPSRRRVVMAATILGLVVGPALIIVLLASALGARAPSAKALSLAQAFESGRRTALAPPESSESTTPVSVDLFPEQTEPEEAKDNGAGERSSTTRPRSASGNHGQRPKPAGKADTPKRLYVRE